MKLSDLDRAVGLRDRLWSVDGALDHVREFADAHVRIDITGGKWATDGTSAACSVKRVHLMEYLRDERNRLVSELSALGVEA